MFVVPFAHASRPHTPNVFFQCALAHFASQCPMSVGGGEHEFVPSGWRGPGIS